MTRTILLADDSSTVQRVIELTFAEEDIHVVTVVSGEQAIARVETDRPDIVLVDAAMPGKNGYEVASFIKHSPQLSHIPVLLLAGAAEPVDQRRAAEAGCDGVLEKPFEPELVIARVKELLRGAGTSILDLPLHEPVKGANNRNDSLDEFFVKLDGVMTSLTAFGPDEKTVAPPVVKAVSPPTGKSTLPALKEAFAALLAAEQEAGDSTHTAWPNGPTIGDELVDRVAARVLERMSDRVVRETVSNLVSSVAERLVREEIERIKATIK